MIKNFIKSVVILIAIVACPLHAIAICDNIAIEDVGVVASRLDAIESQLRAVPPPERSGPAYRELQLSALRELELYQCARETLAPPEEVMRGPNVDTPILRVPILFATDRENLSAPDGRHNFFGPARRAAGVAFGRIIVSLPAEKYDGKELPYGTTISKVRGTSQGVTVEAPKALSNAEFNSAIDEYAKGIQGREPVRLLIFVHGYNVSHVEAIKSAALPSR